MKSQREVIVIGAGMAGILIAYYLQKEGKDVLVLEAKEIASGQTGRTTAKITSQHGMKYHKLMKEVGKETAQLYAKANEEAIDAYEKLIQELEIQCEFKRISAYLYTKEDRNKIEQELEAALELGILARFTTETELPFLVKGAVEFQNQAQFLPHAFVQQISKHLEIKEHTRVEKIEGNQVFTNQGIFTAKDIVMATHYPFQNVPGFYFMRQHQERSYVLALSGCKEMKGMYYSADKNGLSLRQMDEYLILGGGAHRTGASKKGRAYDFLEEAKNQYFPQSRIVDRWSAQDCMTHDGIPFIGKFSIRYPNLYVATGFQKWGMTTSMVAAHIIRDHICGYENVYAKVFSPQRLHILAGTLPFFVDAGYSIKGLTKGLFCKKKPRCPHMGCELVWNPYEESWDCPCHGSRFTKEGKLLDNPAEENL